MAIINKPDMTNLWASGGAVIAPSPSKVQTGWTAEIPPHQWENWVQNRQDNFIAHVDQRGIPEWSGTTEYEGGGISYVQGTNGVVYKSVAPSGPSSTVQNPTTDGTNTYWRIAFVEAGSSIQIYPTTPLTNVGQMIYVLDREQVLLWKTVGSFTGYISSEVGDFKWGTSIVPKPGTETLIGQTIDRTLSQYAALVAWAEVNGHMVPSGDWEKGAFHFASLGGNSVRLPDLRDQFIRATGTDADTANERGLGTKQADALQNISGGFFNLMFQDNFLNSPSIARGVFQRVMSGAAGGKSTSVPADQISTEDNDEINFNASRVARTSTETRGSNTAFHPLIAL